MNAVLVEVAAAFKEEYADVLDLLRELAVILAGLENITGPDRVGRIVATVPSFTWDLGLDEQPVVAPNAAIANARAIWADYASAIDKDALAPIDLLKFPDVDPHADDSRISYHELSPVERHHVDMETMHERMVGTPRAAE